MSLEERMERGDEMEERATVAEAMTVAGERKEGMKKERREEIQRILERER